MAQAISQDPVVLRDLTLAVVLKLEMTSSVLWLLMSWLLVSSDRQQP